MSGGSFNYLCFAAGDPGALAEKMSDLTDMAGELERLTDGKRAARATMDVIRLLRGAGLASVPLAEVWRAVEWAISGDGHAGQVREALAAYNAEHGQQGDRELSRLATTQERRQEN